MVQVSTFLDNTNSQDFGQCNKLWGREEYILEMYLPLWVRGNYCCFEPY